MRPHTSSSPNPLRYVPRPINTARRENESTITIIGRETTGGDDFFFAVDFVWGGGRQDKRSMLTTYPGEAVMGAR